MKYLKGIACVLLVVITWEARAGFVHVDPSTKSTFLDQEGRPLTIHGVNRFAIYEAKDNKDDMSVEQYFKYLADNRFNLVRVFVREGYVNEGRRDIKIPLESELGTYNPEHVRELDSVFEMARKYKIYVMLCMFDHYYMAHSWVDDVLRSGVPIERATPYYIPGTTSDEFYIAPAARAFARKRAAFLANRYKDQEYLFAWEPMNEVNGVLKSSYGPENSMVLDWYEDVAEAIKDADPNHMVSLSLTGDLYYAPEGEFQPWANLYKSRYTDVIQVHSYGFEGPNWRSFLTDKFAQAIQVSKGFGKPVMAAEFSVRSDNPNRYAVIKAIYQLAREKDVPAMIWTHRYDQFGELDDQIIKIYHDINFGGGRP